MTANDSIRVKISSEDAGAISMSPVLVRELPVRELLELVISVTGKDPSRVSRILERGSFVKGLSRLRWEGFSPSFDLAALLDSLPGDQPERAFDKGSVRELVVEQRLREFSISSDLLRKKRLLRKQPFLDVLLGENALPQPVYEKYDYDAKADRFRLEASPHLEMALRKAAPFLPGRGLREALAAQPLRALVFLLPRTG